MVLLRQKFVRDPQILQYGRLGLMREHSQPIGSILASESQGTMEGRFPAGFHSEIDKIN